VAARRRHARSCLRRPSAQTRRPAVRDRNARLPAGFSKHAERGLPKIVHCRSAATASVTASERGTAVTPARIAIEPHVALQDAPLRIRLEGFAPLLPVRLSASMTSRANVTWRSWARFLADANGVVVEVWSAAPLDGSYRGISPMGLIWSMKRDDSISNSGSSLRIRDSVIIEFLAEGDGKAARVSVQRQLAGPGVTFKQLEPSSTLKGGWWLPARPVPHSVIIVPGGSGGSAEHERCALCFARVCGIGARLFRRARTATWIGQHLAPVFRRGHSTRSIGRKTEK
jgi:Acyl-CoA thioester hydrolase/BAAT N-terminal region